MLARLAAALACAGLLAACSAPRVQPDVILISVDTLRADHLGAYGDAAAHTPTIDALAARGRLFSQATTPLPRTTPALASLLTGLEPRSHGSREVGEPRRAGTTLAEVLARRGWATVGVSANGVAGVRENLATGFARFVERKDLPGERATYVTDATLAAVAGVSRDRPLFLWAHYVDPHYSYNPPADFDPGEAGAPCRALMDRVKRHEITKGQMQGDEGGVSSAVLSSCTALYDGEIAYADHEIGRLLQGLRRDGRLRHAYLVFTADHGENLGEADLYFEHGPSLHDASLRVPLLFLGPDVAVGRDDQSITLQDVAPTLLALLGIPRTERPAADGIDQSARVRGAAPSPTQAERIVFAESGSPMHPDYTRRPWAGTPDGLQCFHDARWSYCGTPGGRWTLRDRKAGAAHGSARHPDVVARFEAARAAWTPGEVRERCARTTRFKLLARPQLAGGWRRMLYDLRADPAETRDVSLAHPQVAARLGSALDRWLAAAPFPPAPAPSDTDTKALRALGYID